MFLEDDKEFYGCIPVFENNIQGDYLKADYKEIEKINSELAQLCEQQKNRDRIALAEAAQVYAG